MVPGRAWSVLNRPLASTADSVKPRPFYQPKGRLQRSLEEISLAQARVSIEQEESLYAAGFIVSFASELKEIAMGMFDDVMCDVPLPDGHKGAFQTKDLECTINRYRITKNKRLVRESQGIGGGDGKLDLNYHGILRFYGTDSNDEWHEYNAKFTDGECVEISSVL